MTLATKSSVRAEKIVQAAGKLFANQGYHGTTTRQIAHLADVSENTLFRHFENKEDLFWSALRFHSPGLKLRRDALDGIAQCDAPEVVLPKVLDMLTDMASYKPELLRLIAVAFLELHWKADAYSREFLSPVLSAVSRYLELNMESGKLRNLDPTMLTSALVMTTLMHPEICRLIQGAKPVFSSSQEAGRRYARLWLDLLAPRTPAYPWPVSRIAGENSG